MDDGIREPTAAGRCEDCAFNRRKSDRFNAPGRGGEFLDFEEAVNTETPFWCHAPNARQVCRGWLAIMERRWYRDGWSVESPREKRS
jgi:hypothetical protein